jgi:hypothetical protein
VTELARFGNVVPTGPAVHGNTVCFSEAGPVPHDPATGKVLTLDARNRTADEFGSGGPLLVDVEFGRGVKLLALSQGFGSGNPPGSPAVPNTGSLLQVNEDGSFTAVDAPLNLPTSMEIIRNVVSRRRSCRSSATSSTGASAFSPERFGRSCCPGALPRQRLIRPASALGRAADRLVDVLQAEARAGHGDAIDRYAQSAARFKPPDSSRQVKASKTRGRTTQHHRSTRRPFSTVPFRDGPDVVTGPARSPPEMHTYSPARKSSPPSMFSFPLA